MRRRSSRGSGLPSLSRFETSTMPCFRRYSLSLVMLPPLAFSISPKFLRERHLLVVGDVLVAEDQHRVAVHAGLDRRDVRLAQRLAQIDAAHLAGENRMDLADRDHGFLRMPASLRVRSRTLPERRGARYIARLMPRMRRAAVFAQQRFQSSFLCWPTQPRRARRRDQRTWMTKPSRTERIKRTGETHVQHSHQPARARRRRDRSAPRSSRSHDFGRCPSGHWRLPRRIPRRQHRTRRAASRRIGGCTASRTGITGRMAAASHWQCAGTGRGSTVSARRRSRLRPTRRSRAPAPAAPCTCLSKEYTPGQRRGVQGPLHQRGRRRPRWAGSSRARRSPAMPSRCRRSNRSVTS